MDLHQLFESSLFLQNWHIALTTILAIAVCSVMVKRLRKVRRGGEKTLPQIDVHSDADYIGAHFDANDTNKDENGDLTSSLENKEHVRYKGATVKLPQGARQFYEMMNNRRSARSFSTRAVPIAVLEDCVRAAGTAPSGAHTEPWTYCIVSNPQLKSQIRTIVETEEALNYAQRMHRQWTADLQPLRTTPLKPYLIDAPYLVLVFKQIYGHTANGQRRHHYYNEISVAISIGILICALQAAGLSSVVTTPLNCGPALRTLLERPANEKLLALLPVGYADDNCTVPDLQRKDLKDISLWL